MIFGDTLQCGLIGSFPRFATFPVGDYDKFPLISGLSAEISEKPIQTLRLIFTSDGSRSAENHGYSMNLDSVHRI